MKLLLLALIIFLTIYAPIELTRVIIVNEFVLRLHPDMSIWGFTLELIEFWSFYVIAMVIIWRLLNVKQKGRERTQGRNH